MLQHWFSSTLYNSSEFKGNSLGAFAKFSAIDTTNNNQNKVALITANNKIFSSFRKALYDMPNHFTNILLIDFGALANPGHDSFIQVHKELLSSQIVPIYLGFDRSFVKSLITAQNTAFDHQECSVIAKDLNLIEYILEQKLLSEKKLSPLGFQTHLSFPQTMEIFPSSYISDFRLGKLRSNLSSAEPIIRQANTLILNLNVLRKSDLPELEDAPPSGFNSEELSQLGKYIGVSEQGKSILILGTEELKTNYSSQLLSQLIWYILEGFDKKFNETIDENNSNFTSYSVESNSQNLPLNFIKSSKSGKWWVKHLEHDNKYIACSYQDYVMTCNDDIPERILNNCLK